MCVPTLLTSTHVCPNFVNVNTCACQLSDPKNKVLCVNDGDDPTVVVMVLPPDQPALSTLALLRHGLYQLPFKFGLGTLFRTREVMGKLEESEKLLTAQLRRFWYLDYAAVKPSCQGAGIGGTALDTVLAQLKSEEDVPVLLNTYSELARKFYRKHSFRELGSHSAPQHLVHWCLWNGHAKAWELPTGWAKGLNALSDTVSTTFVLKLQKVQVLTRGAGEDATRNDLNSCAAAKAWLEGDQGRLIFNTICNFDDKYVGHFKFVQAVCEGTDCVEFTFKEEASGAATEEIIGMMKEALKAGGDTWDCTDFGDISDTLRVDLVDREGVATIEKKE